MANVTRPKGKGHTMSKIGTLSPRQARAISALLVCTVAEAAEVSSISRSTLYRWLDDPEFTAALRQAEGELLDAATRRLLAGQAAALDALEELIDHPGTSDGVRRQAARDWLEICLRYRAMHDLEGRIAELENRIYGDEF